MQCTTNEFAISFNFKSFLARGDDMVDGSVGIFHIFGGMKQQNAA